MKKYGTKILAIVMLIVTLTSVFIVPAYAEYNYPMDCTIYYKDENGNQVADTKKFSMNAASEAAQAVKYYSPTVSNYSLKNDSDEFVTYSMMDKSFPASHYVRKGTATYTVYYVRNKISVIDYKFSDGRTAAPSKTISGKPGASYSITSPSVTGYTPSKATVTGTYGDGFQTVYYYEKTYTVSYNANGGTGAPSSQTKKHGVNLTLSSSKPTRTGYDFQGWGTYASDTTVDYSPGGTFTINGNTTLYAIWASKTYTISYNANGGIGAPSSQTKYYGSTLTLSSVKPTRSGYEFIGWGLTSSSTSASYQPGESYTSNVSRTFYAVWRSTAPTTYTVSYNANGGSGAPASQTKTHGVALTLSSTTPTRSGYSFLGWGTTSNTSSVSYFAGESYTNNFSITLYAVWSCNHSSTSINYVTGCNWNRVCNTCGKTLSSGTTHGPYSYGDWVYDSTSQHKRSVSCNHGDYSSYEYASHASTTVYEKYNGIQHQKYSYCNTCASMIGTVSYETHSFTSTTSGGKTITVCSLCGYTRETVQTYTVSYNANGGSGAPASQIKTHGVTLTLSSVIPTRSGYTFNGWGTSSSTAAISYLAGGSYTNNAPITLYAVWECSHSSSSLRYVTNCDWERVCNTCGAVLSTGTTHGSYTYTDWEYLSDTQHSRDMKCTHGDYTEKQYQGHSLQTKFEPYTASQHKYYSYCSVCDSKIGNESYEPHSFTAVTSGGSTVYTCASCGYSYSDKLTYTVTFHANGGIGAPSSQTKIYGEALTLSSTVPTRDGYDFKGWATASTSTSVTYQAGGRYTDNANISLYAVWEQSIYTISYKANGGSGAPGAQTKTMGQTVTISSVVPTRYNHAFMGWATSDNAESAEYYGGESYYADASVTLYAVWVERNYDFSVSELIITPNEVEQYGKVNVAFRLDSWDRNLPYDNIPVEVLLNGSVIYSVTVDFVKYGIQNVSFDLNVGAIIGEQTITARVNWADRVNETRSENNATSATFTVKRIIETSAEHIEVNGEYIEGFEVITSFYAVNDASSDILPDDNVTFDFLVYTMEGSMEKVVNRQTWNNVVIPANGKNLVYFKWRIPEGSAGTTYFCKGTINSSNAEYEQDSENNTIEFSLMAKSLSTSQTANTRYEAKAPASYLPSAAAPTVKSGSAAWNMWAYENGEFVLKKYGMNVSSEAPELLPSSACLTAEKVGSVWKMKSGYGVTLAWNPKSVSRSGYSMPSADAYTAAQCVYAAFPEYAYSTASEKYRTLELSDGYYRFVQNADADNNERIHFIPIYVRNGDYTVSVAATQIWTPAGMITAVRNVSVVIDGTIYDDWYQG